MQHFPNPLGTQGLAPCQHFFSPQSTTLQGFTHFVPTSQNHFFVIDTPSPKKPTAHTINYLNSMLSNETDDQKQITPASTN